MEMMAVRDGKKLVIFGLTILLFLSTISFTGQAISDMSSIREDPAISNGVLPFHEATINPELVSGSSDDNSEVVIEESVINPLISGESDDSEIQQADTVLEHDDGLTLTSPSLETTPIESEEDEFEQQTTTPIESVESLELEKEEDRPPFEVTPIYTRGDVDLDGEITFGDASQLIAYIFKDGPATDPLWVMDMNKNNKIEVGDATSIISYVIENMGTSGDDYIVGDVNNDGSVNVGDATYLFNYIYGGGPEPIPMESGDVNGDGSVNVGDVLYLMKYLFEDGPAPVDPDDNSNDNPLLDQINPEDTLH